MKSSRIVFLGILLALLLAGSVAAIFLLGEEFQTPLNIIIIALIIILGGYFIYQEIKIDREKKEGLPPEDELSNLIKYRAGYKAYLASMYMWLFIFIFKDKFPDTETMLGGGILLSAIIYMIIRATEKKKYLE